MKLAIQAIIMAGGEGVRLRPLTLEAPKPLVPLLGEPVMGSTMRLVVMGDAITRFLKVTPLMVMGANM